MFSSITELITLTRGNNGVKTYDMKTGKTRAVLYPPPDVKELQERFDTSTFSVRTMFVSQNIYI